MTKRIIAFAMILIMLAGLCACGKNDDRVFRTLGTVGTREYAVMCRSGDSLGDILDAAISVLAANGRLSYISTQWLAADKTCFSGDPNALNGMATEIQPRGLIVGVDSGFNPLAYTDENGEAKGLFVDVAYALGELLGWEIRIQSFSRNELAAQLSSGNIDCAVGFDSGLISGEKYHIGPSVLKSDIVVAVRTESSLKKISQLDGRRVGTVEDSSIEKLVKNSDKLSKNSSGTTQYLSAGECVRAMDKGWCAAIVLDAIMLAYYEFN